MSKKKTDMEMILDMLKQYIDEAEKPDNCEDCEYWDEDCDCCDGDCEEEDEVERDEEENEEEQYYRYPECECVDGECDQCDHWVNKDYCELDDIYENCEGHEICGCSDEDCYSCKGSKENTQIEDLSKFIISINTVLGGDMGLLVFDKSNKKDMEKIAAIFGEYAKRL